MTLPTFDYDYLKQLVRENPTASRRELAIAVTMREREVRNDPTYPMRKDSAIGAVLSRYRATWLDEGGIAALPPRLRSQRSQPFDNIPGKYLQHNTYLKRLRTMTRIARQDLNIPERDKGLALSFARQLQRERKVIDLMPSGQPRLRVARPDELDSTGEIIRFTARYPGLTDRMWASLSPDERRIASYHWLPPGREGGPGPADLGLSRGV